MRSVVFAGILLLGLSGTLVGAQKLLLQDDRISDAFNIGFLAMAPKIMCADTIETVFITLTNMTRPVEMMVVILDGPDDILVQTPIRFIGTPCACMELRIPRIYGSRRVVVLQLLARRLDLQCDDFEVTVEKRIRIDACVAETFIETDKPVYIAGETVKFRVLTLKTDLRPDTTPVQRMQIEDPNKVPIIEWKDVVGTEGLIEKEMPLSKEPPLGQWIITIMHHGQSYELPFQVEKYELPRFGIVIEKPPYIYVDRTRMKLKICARYPMGQAVPGSIEVKISVINKGHVPSKKKRPVLTFKEEDTGLVGCFDAHVDLEHLELCSEKYTLADDARLRISIIYTDAATGVTIKEVDKETIIAKEPFTMLFDASPVYKPGLPYHGRIVIRNPDETPADRMPVRLTGVGNAYSIYEDILYPNEEGIIYFTIDEIMYELKTLTLMARTGYKPTGACRLKDSIPVVPPEASFTALPQYSPSGSFIQILPITERVKIKSLQTITIYFVTQKPEHQGINFHVMFMSRGNIIRSTEVYILPEDYDGFRHRGSYLPIPKADHEQHTGKGFAVLKV
ncbi:ovostatin-like [Amphiura filiformis]|uniref:ovostatin-like n=1 Tax=Amphiura filiformis TaxID=82378 RepID=UPI003B2124B5